MQIGKPSCVAVDMGLLERRETMGERITIKGERITIKGERITIKGERKKRSERLFVR